MPSPAPLLALLAVATPQDLDATIDELRRIEMRTTPEVEVVRSASPAVVYIESHQVDVVDFNLGRFVYGTRVVSGSGAVLHSDGFVITNAHVIGHTSERVTVEFDAALDSTVYEARVISLAPNEDLALLKIDSEREFVPIVTGTSSDLMLGERVIAIGNPLRQRLSVSTGIISGLHRNVRFNNNYTFRDLIQTDAAINPGNSGGPLLNILGELVGITTVVNEGAENMGFAIPVDRVLEVYEDVLTAPDMARAWFGMQIDESCEFSVAELFPGGPAQAAGVLPGDRLISLDGTPVIDSKSYRAALVALEPDAATELVFARGEERIAIILEGWTRISRILHEHAGMSVDQVWLSGVHQRVRIKTVQEDGPAALLGLRPGDVLDSLRVPGGKAWLATTPPNLARMVAAVGPGATLEVDVRRDVDGNGRLTDDEFLRGTLRLR